jgi:hypothetical protein
MGSRTAKTSTTSVEHHKNFLTSAPYPGDIKASAVRRWRPDCLDDKQDKDRASSSISKQQLQGE